MLTDTGLEVLRMAEDMERMAVSFERRGEGADTRVAGEVRVTTTDALAVDFVIPAMSNCAPAILRCG